MNRDESSTATSSGRVGFKRRWLSLLVSALLWLMALELILWFVPVQPRVVIRTIDNLHEENLAGFSPDGRTLVTTIERMGKLTGQIHLWEANTGLDLGVVGEEGTNLLPNVVYCAQGNLLTESGFSEFFDRAAVRTQTYVLYDLNTHQITSSIRLEFENEAWHCLRFTPDGRTLAFCTNTESKGELKLVDVATGQVRVRLKGGSFEKLVISQDGKILATTERRTNPDDSIPDEEKIIVLEIATGKTWRTLQNYGEALHPCLSPDGKKLAADCLIGNPKLGDIKDREVTVWDLTNGKQTASFEAEGFPEFLEDDRGLALWHQEGVSFCDSNTGKEYAIAEKTPPFMGFMGYVPPDLVPIPSTHFLAVQTSRHSKPGLFFQWCANCLGIKGLGEERNDEELAFLDTRTGKEVTAIIRPRICEVKIFPDGTKLALTTFENDDSIIEIWDIPPRKPLSWVLSLLAIPSVVTLITLARWWKGVS